MPKLNDLTGVKFGKLTVARFSHRKPPHTYWECQCDCGGYTIASSNNLKRGQHSSCGCGHGMSRTPEYEAWYNMRLRCGYIEGRKARRNYSNVFVDESWGDFTIFLEDVGKRPSDDHSLDRINPNGGYEKSNVRWATRLEQARNKRKHAAVHLPDGRILTTWDYAKELSVSRKAAWQLASRKHYLDKLIEIESQK